jgi:hypothetical protein
VIIRVRYPGFGDYIKIKNPKDIDAMFKLIVDCVECVFIGDRKVDKKETEQKELINFLENLTSSEFENLLSFFINQPYVKISIPFHCKSCGHEEIIDVTDVMDFFQLPSRT